MGSATIGGTGATGRTPAAVALERLVSGNLRFATGEPDHPNQSISHRKRVAESQEPIAAVLGCADSRVAPELLFDQGLGDLFTVRIAGNIVDDAVENSLAFAVEQLGVPLIVVLGHQDCGAVQTTLSALEAGQAPENHPNSLVRTIGPVARNALARRGDPFENTIRDNIRHSVERLSTARNFRSRVETGTLQVTGAYYHLATGRAEVLE